MSTLYIRLPSKAAAERAPHWLALVCPFALAAPGGALEREGAAPLSELAELVAGAQRVVLLLAAGDVSLLRVQAPPLSAARLKAALPNLVEEQLIADPAECVVVGGALAEGLRTVAVVQRAWFESVTKTFIGFGARQLAALPAQLCLPHQPEFVSAALNEQGATIDLALRLTQHDGIGLTIMPEQPAAAADEVLATLRALVPQAPITLYVAQARVPAYQQAVSNEIELDQRISVFADNWPRWIAGANSTTLDLMAGLGASAGPRFDWRPWRWPLALAAALLAVNALALNIGWWRLQNEADALRASMTQIYKSAYPKEPVIVDPIAQMRQKIAAAKRAAGQVAADDFTALTAAFGDAWSTVAPARPAIAALEYRDRSLWVRLKGDGQAPTEQMKAALAARGLALNLAPAQAGVVWQIRSAK